MTPSPGSVEGTGANAVSWPVEVSIAASEMRGTPPIDVNAPPT